MAAYRRVYDSRHLQADSKNRNQLRNPMLGNRVLATFTFLDFCDIHILSKIVIQTAHIVWGAGSMKLSGVRLTVSLSVPLFARYTLQWQVCCWVPCQLEIDRQPDAQQQRRHSMVHSSKFCSAVNASSVTFTVDEWSFYLNISGKGRKPLICR